MAHRYRKFFKILMVADDVLDLLLAKLIWFQFFVQVLD